MNKPLTDMLRELGVTVTGASYGDDYEDIALDGMTARIPRHCGQEFDISGYFNNFNWHEAEEFLIFYLAIRDSESPAVQDLFDKLKVTAGITTHA